MSEWSTRCVIVDNMEANHRRVALLATNMEGSHRRVAAPVTTMEASHRRVAATVANMRQGACHGSTLVVKAREVWLSLKLAAAATIGVTRWHWRPSPCCTDDIDDHGLQERNNRQQG